MWYEMAKCNHCDEIVGEFQFCSPFFKPVCPVCGGDNSFRKVTAKYTFLGASWKPWTWFSYEWVEK